MVLPHTCKHYCNVYGISYEVEIHFNILRTLINYRIVLVSWFNVREVDILYRES